MERLLREQVQWDITVAVGRDEGELRFSPYAGGPMPDREPLTELVHVAWSEPLVLVGRLPDGVVEVRGGRAAGGAWLAVGGPPAFVFAYGRTELVELPPEPPPPVLVLPEPTPEGYAYAGVLAAALAHDAAAHPPPGDVVRAVVRWFWEGDPLYLTLHLLGTGDPQPGGDDAWYPLEWDNEEREFERTDRVLARPDVQRAGDELAATFEGDDIGEAHLPAVIETVRRLPAALAARGLPLAEAFGAAAAHFEGWGFEDTAVNRRGEPIEP